MQHSIQQSDGSSDLPNFHRFNPLSGIQPELSYVSWISLQQIYPNLSQYGGPTFILPVKLYLIIGTAKGSVLIFNKNQFVQSVLSPAPPEFRSKVLLVDVNQDGTHVCAGYESGDIFLWDLNVEAEQEVKSNRLESIMHITKHRGLSLKGLQFVPGRHTNVIASDSTGRIILHRGTRNHLWQLSPTEKLLMRLNPMTNPIFATQLQLNCTDKSTYLLAVLASRSFAIISVSATELSTYKMVELPTNPPCSCGYISWNKSVPNRVAFSIDNTLHISDVQVPGLQYTFQAPETVYKVSWVTEKIVALLLSSSRLIMLDTDSNVPSTSQIVCSIDLLAHDILLPDPGCHFATLYSRFFVLTNYSVIVGTINSWSDIVLHHLHLGDYINALGTLSFCLQLSASDSLIGLLRLEANMQRRIEQIEPSFNNLTLATVQFLLKQDHLSYEKITETASLILDSGTLFSQEKMYDLLEKVGEALMSKHNEEFQEILYQKISDGTITYLSPIVFKAIMQYTVSSGNDRRLETILLSLDVSTLDIDYAVKICKEVGLYSAVLYLWIVTLEGYDEILSDIILFFAGKVKECVVIDSRVTTGTLFEFIGAVLVGKLYPTEKLLEEGKSLELKNKFYGFIFSGSCLEWPAGSGHKLSTRSLSKDEPVFPYASLLLFTDPVTFLNVLDRALEDVLFNDSPHNGFFCTRQFIIDTLLDILKHSDNETVQLQVSLFVCKMLPRYTQFIRLTDTVLESLIDILSSSNKKYWNETYENCLEALFSVYTPKNVNLLIEKFPDDHFNRVRLMLYRKAGRYSDYLQCITNAKNDNVSNDDVIRALDLCLQHSNCTPSLHMKVAAVVSDRFVMILMHCSDLDSLIPLISAFDTDIHDKIFCISDSSLQLRYLRVLLTGDNSLSSTFLKKARPLYVSLLYDAKRHEELAHWLSSVDINSIATEEIIGIVKRNNDPQTLINLLIRSENYETAVDEINQRVNDLITCNVSAELKHIVDLGIDVSLNAKESNKIWVKFISNLIHQYSGLTVQQKALCDDSIQKAFIKLSEVKLDANDSSKETFFWRTNMEIFESQHIILSKVKDIRAVLEKIFTAYTVQEMMNLIILRIARQSASTNVKSFIKKRRSGWTIQSRECDVCGKKIWGIGITSEIFDQWEAARRNFNVSNDSLAIIAFSSGHAFHISCLKNMGQIEGKYECLTSK